MGPALGIRKPYNKRLASAANDAPRSIDRGGYDLCSGLLWWPKGHGSRLVAVFLPPDHQIFSGDLTA